MCKICDKEYDEKTTELECIDCDKITSISDIPSLQKLTVNNCRLLTSISNLNLKELNCYNCKLLKNINSSVNYLTYSNCPKLNDLSMVKSLIYLTCSSDVISNNDTLEYIWCNDSNISTISNCPNLKYVYNTNCPNLKTISGCPNLKNLYYQKISL